MLQINTETSRRFHPTPKKAPVVTITAMDAAKVHRTPKERAAAAAAYVKGSLLIIEPTGALAAKVFSVSQSAVSRALSEIGGPVASCPVIDQVWNAMDPPSRDAFVRKHGDQLLRCLDRVTS
jgi:hypothetical protein